MHYLKLFFSPRLIGFVIVIKLLGEQYAFATETLSPITVTSSGKSLEKQINNPQQLDENEVTVAHERSITDVIQGFPGVSITQTGGFGQLSAIFMRGAGGQGLTTLDDIPLLLSLPGLQNLDTLPSEAIKTVEIQRGPDSAHQSFQALGGAMRFSTKDREETGARLSVEGGTYSILRETLQGGVSGKHGRMTMTVNRADAFEGAHFADSSNNPERDPFRFSQGIMRFSTDLSDNVNWQGSMLYRKSWTGSDMLGLDKNFRVAFQDDNRSFGEAETWLAQNNLNVAITPDWDSRLQLGFTQLANTVKVGTSINSLNNRIYLANWRNQHTLIDYQEQNLLWQFSWGGQGRHEQGESQSNRFNQERTMASGFLETEASYGDLKGQLGVRVEHYEQYGDHPLFKAAAGWKLTPELTLRASGGTGYRIPSYTELLSPFFGNLQLKPERSSSGELSLEWFPLKNMQLSVNGFYHRYDDLIVQAYDPRRGPISLNVPDASVAGVELDTKYAWTEALDTGFSYTYNDNLDLGTNRLLPFRPPHTARVWAKQKLTGLPVTLWAETVFRSATWNDSANRIPIKQSVHFNATIRYAVTSQFELYLRGENLTNNRATQFYSTDMPGVMVFGGFELNL
jgi:vitamin B12 transporter